MPGEMMRILMLCCFGMLAAGSTPATEDAFWIFSDEGVKVYSKDGATLVKQIRNSDMCLKTDDGQTCDFTDAESNGKDYVLATNTHGGNFVEVFSTTSGAHIASIPTCGRPQYIQPAPFRDEAWVHCWSPQTSNGDLGHVDIFSTNAWGLDHQQIDLWNGVELDERHVRVRIDSALPNYAYATKLDLPALTKVNVHTREVTTLWINESVAEHCSGYFRMEISGVNKHAFLRCYVCCTCGVDGDTGRECSSRDGNVTLSDGTVAMGRCGNSCKGTPPDNVGVLEYDLIGESLIGRHIAPGNVGAANPYVSPKGDLLVLLSEHDAIAKILKIESNGVLSNDAAASDVPLDFEYGDDVTDVVFIEDDTYSLVIFASGTEDFLVVADSSHVRQGRAVQTTKVDIPGSAASRWGRGGRRNVVWAEGSRYVMVNSNGDDKVHIIDLGSTGNLMDVRVLKTLDNTPTGIMVYVPAMHGEQAEQVLQPVQGEQGMQGIQGKRGIQGLPGASANGESAIVVVCIVLSILSCGLSVGTSAHLLRKVSAMLLALTPPKIGSVIGKPAEETVEEDVPLSDHEQQPGSV